jgi:hypothetical protein
MDFSHSRAIFHDGRDLEREVGAAVLNASRSTPDRWLVVATVRYAKLDPMPSATWLELLMALGGLALARGVGG